MWVTACKSRWQFNSFQQLFDSLTPLRGRDIWAIDEQGLSNTLLNSEIGIERSRWVLENETHALTQFTHVLSLDPTHFLT